MPHGLQPLLGLALFVVTALALLPDLGGQYVWSRDEARPALVARDMMERGHWLIPHLGGRIYAHKPPLFPWLVALVSRDRITEWSLRLPSVLAGAGTVTATWAIGARLGGLAAGLVAAALLASSAAFVEWARTGRMDMLLVFWVTFGFWSGMRWIESGRRRDAIALGLALGFGGLTKGPLALLPLGAVLVAIVVLGRWSRPRLADLALVVAIGAALPLTWLGLAAGTQEGFGRYAGAVFVAVSDDVSARRFRKPLHVFTAIGVGFLPWTLVLPGAVAVVVRCWRSASRTLLLPLLWVALVLGPFALFVSPREVHVLPIFPALALLVAWAWSSCSGRERVWMILPLALLLLGLVIGGTVLAVSPLSIEIQNRITVLSRGFGMGVAVMVSAASLAAAALLRRRRADAAAIVVAAGILGVLMLIQIGVHTPRANRTYPTREVAARFAAALPPGAEVAYLDRKLSTGLVFYLRQPSVELAEMSALRNLVARPHLHAILPSAETNSIRWTERLPVRPLREENLFGERYVLLDLGGVPAPTDGRRHE